MVSRFGSDCLQSINEEVKNCAPKNTIKSKKSVWRQFEKFCGDRGYDVSTKALPVEKLNDILMDWAFNMRKSDGTHYKELVVKQMWNSIAKQMQEKYYEKFKIKINPFADIVFKTSRNARDMQRKKMQLNPALRKASAAALTESEIRQMIEIYDENKPDELQKKFYHVAAHELAWRGGEATFCLITHFKEEQDNKGLCTGRIEYNPIISKTAQGGAKRLTDSKWLIPNKENESVCPVRLLRKLLSKRGQNITSNRLFLTPNLDFNPNNSDSLWFKNSPVGKNTISKWTKLAAEAVGINTKQVKISNHSHRSSAISHLAKAGVPEQSLIKISGHSSSSSIKPYLQFDEEHHAKIVKELRSEKIVETNTSVIETKENHRIVYQNCTFNITNY